MSMIGVLLPVTSEELELMKNDTAVFEALVTSEDEVDFERMVYLDKAWNGILYLLTRRSLEEMEEGPNDDLSRIFFSRPIDADYEFGYGSPCYLTAAEVKQVAAEVAAVGVSQMKEKYNPAEMEDVYPGGWDDDGIEYIIEYFKIMKETFEKSAAEEKAMITYIE